MSLIAPKYVESVVAIGVPDLNDPDETRWIGTGFMYGKFRDNVESEDGQDERNYRPFLVTNRHVVEGKSEIRILRNATTSGTAMVFIIDGPWEFHPDQDIAVTGVSADQIITTDRNQSLFQDDVDAAGVEQLREIKVLEGDGAFVIGFPLGLVGVETTYPIVRPATVARIGDLLDGSAKTYLIDANVFPGNSGGPVVLAPELLAMVGEKPRMYSRLIGVVVSYIPYQETAYSLQATPPRPRVTFEENSGLASVIPCDAIDEAIANWIVNHEVWA